MDLKTKLKGSKSDLVHPSRISISQVRGVGERTAKYFNKLGVFTLEDLLYYFPRRYLDLSKVVEISKIKIGEFLTVKGKVFDINKFVSRSGKQILLVTISDKTGLLEGVWFNQGFLSKRFQIGAEVAFSGQVLFRQGKLQMQNPLFDTLPSELSSQSATHTSRVIPIYQASRDLSTKKIRRVVKNALDDFLPIVDPIPKQVKAKFHLVDRNEAIKNLHFPSSRLAFNQARNRAVFEELYLLELAILARKSYFQSWVPGTVHKPNNNLTKKLISLLPWELTSDQKRAFSEIVADMRSNKRMHRLLQGEVGSGKTVVAALAMLVAVEGGFQASMMAPTEILAEQHFQGLNSYFSQLKVPCRLLTSSLKTEEKKQILSKIADGEIKVIIGTHALIQTEVQFKQLGLVVIDEQHRFGVEQRLSLKKKGENPDVLVMTATPIPRSLSLTLYGDLDISTIRQLPGKKNLAGQVRTIYCPDNKRQSVYQAIRREVSLGHQAYIVCPLIDESDKLEFKSVLQETEAIKREVFPDLRVGVLHSKVSLTERQATMKEFRQGNLDVLVCTTVIEVGVDIPNATVMVIEHAERYGLSQLHQLRGRIGRGKHQSYCYLFADLTTSESKKRLSAFLKHTDGFKLAEADLQIRGEGEIYGARQSGLGQLKLAHLTRDLKILKIARSQAKETLKVDAGLRRDEHQLLSLQVRERFEQASTWLGSG
jgi:ATP-dependent DNA helicase RecG